MKIPGQPPPTKPKLTKILATMGPVSSKPEVMLDLLAAGLGRARATMDGAAHSIAQDPFDVDAILDLLHELGCRTLFTLGGYGTGKMLEKPRVLGAATDKELVKEMKDRNVTFRKNEPGGGIVAVQVHTTGRPISKVARNAIIVHHNIFRIRLPPSLDSHRPIRT